MVNNEINDEEKQAADTHVRITIKKTRRRSFVARRSSLEQHLAFGGYWRLLTHLALSILDIFLIPF